MNEKQIFLIVFPLWSKNESLSEMNKSINVTLKKQEKNTLIIEIK